MIKSIVWFRNDLRIHDNESLFKACKNADEVLPVYIFDDYYFGKTPFGFDKTGIFRKKILLESVQNLKQSLDTVGLNLLVLSGNSSLILAQLCSDLGINTVYAQNETAFDEVQIENEVQRSLQPKGVKLILSEGAWLFHPNDLPYSDILALPDIFTQHRKKVEYHCKVRPLFPIPEKANLISHQYTDQWPDWVDTVSGIEPDNRTAWPFKGGETNALHHLQDYIWKKQLIATYKITRNGLIGSEYSSKFSPWLALGCISPRQIYHEIKRFESEVVANDSTYWLIFELIWRDYFRLVAAKYRHRIFQFAGIAKPRRELKNNEKRLESWINGDTGNDFVDANMNELRLTGFMSNRGRQNVASFLVNDLKVNWQMGAEYFEQQLIDYDPCSNWGNWCYVSGVGNDPRENRYFNTHKQAEMYDSNGDYRRLWLG